VKGSTQIYRRNWSSRLGPATAPSRVLTPLGLAACLSLFGDLTLYAALATQLDVVGLSLEAVGVMLGVNRLIRIPGNPLAGLLFDRWRRRPLFITGLLLGVLSTASYGLVRGFWPFLVGRLAWGIGWTLINVGSMTIILDISTEANRGRLNGSYNTWVWVGFAAGPLVGGLLVDIIGFRPAMLSCAGVTAAGLTIAALALPETAPAVQNPAKPSPSQDSGEHLAGSSHKAVPALPTPSQGPQRSRESVPVGISIPIGIEEREIWRRVGAGLAAAAGLLLITQFANEGLMLSTLSLLLQQRFDAGVSLGGLTLGLASASGGLLALRSLLAGAVGLLTGYLSDTYTGRRPMIAASMAIGALSFGLLAFATSPTAVLLGVALGAVSGGTALATLTAQVGDLTPPRKAGLVMGAFAMIGDVGSMAGPFLAFALLGSVELQRIYLLCACMFVAGLWLAHQGKRKGCPRERDQHERH